MTQETELDALMHGDIAEGVLLPEIKETAQKSEEGNMSLEEFRDHLMELEQDGLHEERTSELTKALEEVKSIGFSDIADLFEETPDGNGGFYVRMIPITRLPKAVTRSIKKIKVTQAKNQEGDNMILSTVEIEMYNKLDGLDKLLRHYGAYEKDNKQKETAADRALDLIMGNMGERALPAPPNGADSWDDE